jgi:peptide/nickel transport system permease protein
MKKTKPQLYIGAGIIALIGIAALLAPLLASHDPQTMSLANRYEPPSTNFLFGRDQNGADVFSQVLYGARVSLYVSLTVVSLSVLTGLLIGSLAGYVGGRTDNALMRFIDLIHAFPGFLLALSLVAVLGPSIHNLIIAMSITGWTGYARLVRGEVLHLKSRDYVLSARALGAPSMRILVRHIWPNLIGLLVVQATFGMAGTILTESGLSFLGLGAPPSIPTWGSLLNTGRRWLIEAPHVSLFPGLAILCLVFGFNLLGDGLRDRLSPR